MKSYHFLFLFWAFFLSVDAVGQLSVGIKSGYVRAWQDYGDVFLPEGAVTHLHSFQTSVQMYFRINERLEVGVEPGWVKRGAACEPGFTTFNGDTDLHLQYLELPLLFTGRLPVWRDRLEAFGKAGAGVSMVLSGYRQVNSPLTPIGVQTVLLNFNQNESLQRWDVGLHGGLGLACRLGPGKLQLESTMYAGLLDFINSTSSQNRGLFVGLGYLYDL